MKKCTLRQKKVHVESKYKINNAKVEYINIPNTHVDYPVDFSGDNEHNLTRYFDKIDFLRFIFLIFTTTLKTSQSRET